MKSDITLTIPPQRLDHSKLETSSLTTISLYARQVTERNDIHKPM